MVLLAGYYLVTHLKYDSSGRFVVFCLLFIGFGLGLIITPISNMIMTSAPRRYQGMVSSLTSLERYAPMTIGIAFYNIVFIQGMTAITNHFEVTEAAPKVIQMKILTAGFDLTYLFSFLLGIVILVFTIAARYKMHPDYAEADDRDPAEG